MAICSGVGVSSGSTKLMCARKGLAASFWLRRIVLPPALDRTPSGFMMIWIPIPRVGARSSRQLLEPHLVIIQEPAFVIVYEDRRRGVHCLFVINASLP